MRAINGLVISAALLLVMCGGESGGSKKVRYTLRIASGNYLFVYGHELEGDVLCTFQPGDSVRIGGFAVYPRRPEPIPFSEEEIREAFGRTPFIQERVRAGETWLRASQACLEHFGEMERSAGRAYRRELARTGSNELGVKAALDSLDRSLLDSIQVTGNTIRLWRKGLKGATHFSLIATVPSPAQVKQADVPTPEKAMALLVKTSRAVGSEARGSHMEVFTYTGETILTGEQVSQALKQIEDAERVDSASGPLGVFALRDVMPRGPLRPNQLYDILVARRGPAK